MKLTEREIKKLTYNKKPKLNEVSGKPSYPKQIIWDSTPTGFGCRVFPSGRKNFVYQYRNQFGQKRLADIGEHGALTVEEARNKAYRWAALVSDGKDPLDDRNKNRNGALMSDLCEVYIDRHARPHKKSWKEDERRNRLYILPALGNKQVQNIGSSEIAKLHDDIGRINSKPYMANRVREQLSKMFELAKIWEFMPREAINPAKGIVDFPEKERDAYVLPSTMPILARAIEAEKNPVAKCAIWMYILSGKRKNEILQAKYSDIDETANTLKIAGTKNGETEYFPLSDGAKAIIERAKEFQKPDNPYIFPGEKPGMHFVNVRKAWLRIKAQALKDGAEGIEDVTIHGLRHTVGVWLTNLADADLGLVRKIFNHKSLLATKVYAKYKTNTVKAALERHSDLVAQLSVNLGDSVVILENETLVGSPK